MISIERVSVLLNILRRGHMENLYELFAEIANVIDANLEGGLPDVHVLG